jgi:Spy/CpxP family protein refolding chaperone
MKAWIKRTLIGLFGASLLLGGLAACSHGPHGGGTWQASEEDAAKFRTKMVERVGKELELDEAQKQRLGSVVDALRAQRSALVGSTTNPRAEIKALVAGPAFDRAGAQALVEAKTAAVQAKSPEVITALAAFYDGLNPAQQQKVRDFMEGRPGRFGWRFAWRA